MVMRTANTTITTALMTRVNFCRELQFFLNNFFFFPLVLLSMIPTDPHGN